MRMRKWLLLPVLALCLSGLMIMKGWQGLRPQDPRSYMHGIEYARGDDGRTLVFFSSSGLPPSGKWTHDIYVSRWSTADSALSPPQVFIRAPEAQEPVSVAQTDDGHIMVSFEDGANIPFHVSQRYGVYDAGLQPVAPYPLEVEGRGHSGHVAAVGNVFAVFYSEGWIRKDGADSLGTGNGVYAATYDSSGRLLHKIDVAAQVREWWPMIAGSHKRALLIWQQYVPGRSYANLNMAMLNPETGVLSARQLLKPELRFYTYKTRYVPALDRFLVTGTGAAGHGFAYLIDNEGQVTAELPCMPATIREADMAISGRMAYVPAEGNKLLHLSLAPSSIALEAVQPSALEWFTTGNAGLVRDDTHLHWISLSKEGPQEVEFSLGEAGKPSAADRCQ
jgi:hypothetical protein